jgi:hypothetical protein
MAGGQAEVDPFFRQISGEDGRGLTWILALWPVYRSNVPAHSFFQSVNAIISSSISCNL